MNRRFLFSVLGIVSVIVFKTQSSRAADQYSLKIETSFAISDSCQTATGTQVSQIDIVVDGKQNNDPKQLTSAAARIKVCSPFTSPVNETLPIPLPVGLMKASDKVPVGKSLSYSVNAAKFKNVFNPGEAPDSLQVQKTRINVFELRYINKASNAVKIGPIRAFLGSPQSLEKVPGFDDNKHLPISRIEVDVPEKSVTLKADIQTVKTK